MKVLFVTSFFDIKNNSAAIRNNGLVAGLLKRKCIVDVLTVKWPQHMTSDSFLFDKNWTSVERIQISDIFINSKVHNIGLDNHFVRFLKKHIKQVFQFPDLCKKWPSKINPSKYSQYDLIISSSDVKSGHYVAESIVKNNKIKWIQIWGDPWSEDMTLEWYLKRKASKEEYKLLKKANAVVYVSKPTSDLMRKKYVEFSDKISYVPRCFYKSSIERSFHNKDYYKVLYTGFLSDDRPIIPFLQALNEFNKKSNKIIKVEICGRCSADLHKKIVKFNFVNIIGILDYDEILIKYREVDALLFISNPGYSTQIPGKLYDYMGTDKSILCLVPDQQSAISAFLKEHDRCLVLRNNTQIILNNMSPLLKFMNLRWNVETKYSPISVANQVLDIYNLCKN